MTIKLKRIVGDCGYLLSWASCRLKIQSHGLIRKLKLLLGTKIIAGVGLEPNPVGAPCCETWLKFEIKALCCRKEKG
jgi:hypothetical protein